jgi:hypothetical protein
MALNMNITQGVELLDNREVLTETDVYRRKCLAEGVSPSMSPRSHARLRTHARRGPLSPPKGRVESRRLIFRSTLTRTPTGSWPTNPPVTVSASPTGLAPKGSVPSLAHSSTIRCHRERAPDGAAAPAGSLRGSRPLRARRSELAGRSLARSRIILAGRNASRAASRTRCAQSFRAGALRPRSALRRSALARSARPERQRKGTN